MTLLPIHAPTFATFPGIRLFLALGLWNAAACLHVSLAQDSEPESASLPPDVLATDTPRFEDFRLILERNIFDSSRQQHSERGAESKEPTREPRVESFALTGTMIYQGSNLAFFDSATADYRRALKLGDTVANFNLALVTPNQVQLKSEQETFELKVGQQLRREDEGPWKVEARAEVAHRSSQGTSSAPDPVSPEKEEAASDALQRLMQQRRNELSQ